MNSDDMPTPLTDITAITADATNAVSKLLAEYTRATVLITLKNMAIEDLNHKLEELDQHFIDEKEKCRVLDTKINLLLTSNGLLDFDMISDSVPVIPGVNCNEEPDNDPAPETTARRPVPPVPSEPNDLNTDTTPHRTGNLFGTGE